MLRFTMDNQLLRLFVLNSLTHFCLAASISAAPSTTATCFPGSSSVNDCMAYTCDENGRWQEFEFTRTDECCLKTHHPSCAKRNKTPSGQARGFTTTGRATDVSSTGGKWDKTSSEFTFTTKFPSTTKSTPLCDSGSMKSEDCRMFFCHDGQWQVGEFTATKECCLQTFHPKCQAMGFTSTGQATDVSSTGQVTDVSSTEFIPTTQSPTTSTSSPLCDSGSMKSEDCRMFFCQDGQWQVGEFTATQECCLQTFHPKCQAMGFTSTGHATDLTSTDQATGFTTTVTTESPPTTTPVCESGSMIQGNCQFEYCVNGEWHISEFTATKECCLKSFHPRCFLMGFTPTGQATGLTSTEFIVTTQSPPTTTSFPTCDSGSMKTEDCIMFFCQDGQWQVGELIATKECCIRNFLPKCLVMGFTTTDQATGSTSTVTTESTPTTTVCESGSVIQGDCDFSICQNGQWLKSEFIASQECCLQNLHPRCQEMGFTPTEFTSTKIATTTVIHTCKFGSSLIQNCTVFLCENGEWQSFEFLASQECCLNVSHPMCTELGFTGQYTGFTSPASSSTTGSPNADCSLGSSRVEECWIYICENGQWQRFEFFASEECCLKEYHPKCERMGFSSPVSSSTTGSPNVECSLGSSRVQECGIYFCENGQWQLFEFFVSEECCVKENHPKCEALTTPPKDDSSSNEWPSSDYDSDSAEEELDIILIRLPLFPDLPLPVAYRNDRHLNAHKAASGEEHAGHRQK